MMQYNSESLGYVATYAMVGHIFVSPKLVSIEGHDDRFKINND